MILFKRSKSIYNVQEVYPDLLINLGYLNNSIIIFLLKKIERWIYNMSDSITTIDTEFYNLIRSRVKEKGKLTLIPNFVDTEIYSRKNLIPLPNKFEKKEGYTNLLYAGNIGLAQEWRLIIDLAIEIKNIKIEIWIIEKKT